MSDTALPSFKLQERRDFAKRLIIAWAESSRPHPGEWPATTDRAYSVAGTVLARIDEAEADLRSTHTAKDDDE